MGRRPQERGRKKVAAGRIYGRTDGSTYGHSREREGAEAGGAAWSAGGPYDLYETGGHMLGGDDALMSAMLELGRPGEALGQAELYHAQFPFCPLGRVASYAIAACCLRQLARAPDAAEALEY